VSRTLAEGGFTVETFEKNGTTETFEDSYTKIKYIKPTAENDWSQPIASTLYGWLGSSAEQSIPWSVGENRVRGCYIINTISTQRLCININQ